LIWNFENGLQYDLSIEIGFTIVILFRFGIEFN